MVVAPAKLQGLEPLWLCRKSCPEKKVIYSWHFSVLHFSSKFIQMNEDGLIFLLTITNAGIIYSILCLTVIVPAHVSLNQACSLSNWPFLRLVQRTSHSSVDLFTAVLCVYCWSGLNETKCFSVLTFSVSFIQFQFVAMLKHCELDQSKSPQMQLVSMVSDYHCWIFACPHQISSVGLAV